jgi:hypothetical protein
VIVNARGGDVGVAEPFLHLGDVGLVIERVGGGGRAFGLASDLGEALLALGEREAGTARLEEAVVAFRATPGALRYGRGSLLCMTWISPRPCPVRGRDWTRKGGRNWKRFDNLRP